MPVWEYSNGGPILVANANTGNYLIVFVQSIYVGPMPVWEYSDSGPILVANANADI